MDKYSMRYFEVLNESKSPAAAEAILKRVGEKLLRMASLDQTVPVGLLDTDGAASVLRGIMDADPTPKGIYVNWIVREYLNTNIARYEDLESRVFVALGRYNALKPKLAPEQKDIMRLTWDDVQGVVEDHAGADVRSETQKERDFESNLINTGQAEILHNDNAVKVISLKSEDAAKYYGRNTRWCTAADDRNLFDAYYEEGGLYVVLFKKENKRWQFHFESGQFMNELDKPLPDGDILSVINKYLFDKLNESIRANIDGDYKISLEAAKKEKNRFIRIAPDNRRAHAFDDYSNIDLGFGGPPKASVIIPVGVYTYYEDRFGSRLFSVDDYQKLLMMGVDTVNTPSLSKGAVINLLKHSYGMDLVDKTGADRSLSNDEKFEVALENFGIIESLKPEFNEKQRNALIQKYPHSVVDIPNATEADVVRAIKIDGKMRRDKTGGRNHPMPIIAFVDHQTDAMTEASFESYGIEVLPCIDELSLEHFKSVMNFLIKHDNMFHSYIDKIKNWDFDKLKYYMDNVVKDFLPSQIVHLTEEDDKRKLHDYLMDNPLWVSPYLTKYERHHNKFDMLKPDVEMILNAMEHHDLYLRLAIYPFRRYDEVQTEKDIEDMNAILLAFAKKNPYALLWETDIPYPLEVAKIILNIDPERKLNQTTLDTYPEVAKYYRAHRRKLAASKREPKE